MSYTFFFCTGWTGKLCEVPIDECSSNPCQNGAVCIDLHASYSCACLFGECVKENFIICGRKSLILARKRNSRVLFCVCWVVDAEG